MIAASTVCVEPLVVATPDDVTIRFRSSESAGTVEGVAGCTVSVNVALGAPGLVGAENAIDPVGAVVVGGSGKTKAALTAAVVVDVAAADRPRCGTLDSDDEEPQLANTAIALATAIARAARVRAPRKEESDLKT